LDLNMIDNMFIVSKPEEIVQAEEEQAEQLKGDGGLLDFKGLDVDFLEIADLDEQSKQELEFTELDINFLEIDFLRDLLEVIEEADALAEQEEQTGSDRLVARNFGLQADNQFNILPDVDGKVFFLRQATNRVQIKLKKGTTGQIFVDDKDFGQTTICLNNCEGVLINITQD